MSEYVKVNDYDVLFVEDYKGVDYLCLGNVGKDGRLWKRKIKREFGRDNWKDAYFSIPLDAVEELLLNRADARTGGEDAPF